MGVEVGAEPELEAGTWEGFVGLRKVLQQYVHDGREGLWVCFFVTHSPARHCQ